MVQETFLARKIEVICGKYKLSWNNMVAFAVGVRPQRCRILFSNDENKLDYRNFGDEMMRLDMLREACANGGTDQEPRHEDGIDPETLLTERYGVASSST